MRSLGLRGGDLTRFSSSVLGNSPFLSTRKRVKQTKQIGLGDTEIAQGGVPEMGSEAPTCPDSLVHRQELHVLQTDLLRVTQALSPSCPAAGLSPGHAGTRGLGPQGPHTPAPTAHPHPGQSQPKIQDSPSTVLTSQGLSSPDTGGREDEATGDLASWPESATLSLCAAENGILSLGLSFPILKLFPPRLLPALSPISGTSRSVLPGSQARAWAASSASLALLSQPGPHCLPS